MIPVVLPGDICVCLSMIHPRANRLKLYYRIVMQRSDGVFSGQRALQNFSLSVGRNLLAWSLRGEKRRHTDVSINEGMFVARLPVVGDTADVVKAVRTNQIGSPELITGRRDPDSDSEMPAVFCPCVLEILMPRWTAYSEILMEN